MNRLFFHGVAVCSLALMAACGGGGGSDEMDSPSGHAATSLSYTDPAGTGWRLVKQEGSTSKRIVLGLVGPTDTKSRGVGFNATIARGARFGTFSEGVYALDTGVFQLKGSNPNFESYAGTAADPVLFASRLKGDRMLTTGIFQKDRSYAAKSLAKPVVQIVVELEDVAVPSQGRSIDLAVVKARMIPEDIGGMNFTLDMETLAKAKMADIDIAVGALTAN